MSSPEKISGVLPIDSLYGKHAGETLFVIGTSFSLVELNLDLIESYTKIGINRIVRRLPVDYLSISEMGAFKAVEPEIREQDPILLFYWATGLELQQRGKLANLSFCMVRLEDRDGHEINGRGQMGDFKWEEVSPEHPYYEHYPNTFPGKPLSRKRIAEPGHFNRDGLFLRSNSNSVYALEWAYRMLNDGKGTPGRVILLGIDMRNQPRRGHQPLTYIPEINTMHILDTMVRLPPATRIIPHLRKARETMAEANIELLSGSPWDGPLDEFIPRRPLEEILNTKVATKTL